VSAEQFRRCRTLLVSALICAVALLGLFAYRIHWSAMEANKRYAECVVTSNQGEEWCRRVSGNPNQWGSQ
jgi:hypothetical protein